MEKLSLFCGKIELIASKPTLEIREAVIVYYEYQSLPFFFLTSKYTRKPVQKSILFGLHYKTRTTRQRSLDECIRCFWQSGIISETRKPD